LALVVPLSRFTSRVGGGSAFFVRLMSTDDIAGFIVMLCFLVSLVLSLWNVRQKLPFVDRFFPAILQAFILVVSLIPSLHGHPRELFVPMILIFIWSVFAIASSYRLYHIRVGTFRVLGVSQFVESVGIVFGTMLGYVRACYLYYGHLVWNP
jgi:hypothetical protein